MFAVRAGPLLLYVSVSNELLTMQILQLLIRKELLDYPIEYIFYTIDLDQLSLKFCN